MEIENLPVSRWLPLPDVADLLGVEVGAVRTLVQERRLLAVRVGERRIRSVPADFLVPDGAGWAVLAPLAGTLALLSDAGFTDEESLAWLFTADESLASVGNHRGDGPRTPLEALRAGFKGEIRRRAQALGF